MSRARTSPKAVVLRAPQPMTAIKRWVVFGLDPSLSRTGYALMSVRENDEGTASKAKWLEVGSLSPDSSSDPVWVRSKMIARGLRDRLAFHLYPDEAQETGLLISMEYPTPRNDFLVALNRIIHLEFFRNPGVPELYDSSDSSILANNFAAIRILTPNASTLRSLMGLKMRGTRNKAENIDKAYEFLDRAAYPNLDTDSCDGVLMAMLGRWTTSYLLGFPEEPPRPFAFSLTNAAQEVKGKGRNAHVITKGMLHRPEYFYAYEPRLYSLKHNNAREKSRILKRTQQVI